MALPKTPRVETMSVSESRRQYSEILNRVYRDNDRVVIEKNGIPVAAIVPMTVADDADEKERRRTELLDAFHEAQKGFTGVSEEEAEREIAAALEEIKQERKLARRIVSALTSSEPDLFSVPNEYLESEVARLLKQKEAQSIMEALRAGRDRAPAGVGEGSIG